VRNVRIIISQDKEEEMCLNRQCSGEPYLLASYHTQLQRLYLIIYVPE